MDFVRFKAPVAWVNFADLCEEINRQAAAADVPACALAAVVMRETQGRNIYQEGVPHDSDRCGYGLCRITSGVDRTDPENPTFHFRGITYDLFDPGANLFVAAQAFLAPAIEKMTELRRSIGLKKMPEPLLYYVFAAYNAGLGAACDAISGGGNVDNVTTNGYASGTLALYDEALRASHS